MVDAERHTFPEGN